MISKFYWAIVFILFCGFSNAQVVFENSAISENPSSHEQCAHTIAHEKMMTENESYRIEQEQREVMFDQLAEQYRAGLIPKSDEIYTIPLVVHIIHDGDAYGSGSNITDEQVYSAINALNQDFRRMPGTWGDGAGADIGVEFCLARQDPSGNAHSGINRVNGCSVTDYCTEGITSGDGQGANQMAIKNLSRWPKTEYYNIWVVTEIENNNAGGGIQGYAYTPTSSDVDGIVILHNAFGTEGNLKSYTNRNKTLTHEMGHACNLMHTFHNGSCGPETNCNLQGDKICDTPPTILNTSCSSPACGGTQQVENYMDYTSQTCKNMFTEGQKDWMRLALVNARLSLINSNKCESVVAEPADAGITAITAPTGNTCESTVEPAVELTNIGTVPLANVVIEYSTGGAWETYNWTGLLGSGQSVDVVLPAFDGGYGNQTLAIRTDLPNGNADSNTANDEMTTEYSAVQNGYEVSVNITLDNLGGQTTWEIRNSSNDIISSGGPYSNFSGGTLETSVVCVNDDCYDFIIYDSFDNGLCCASGTGSYEVRDQNNTLLASGASFGSSETTNFCLTGNGNPPNADFSANSTTVCAGNEISFTDDSTGDVVIYAWEFFGGSPSTSSAANPGDITYNTPGTFNVRLTVTNGDGSDVELKNNYITVTNNQTWYADTDSDGHGDPNSFVTSCSQPAGYVAAADDCDDSNGNDWDSCYDCLGEMNGPAVLDNCGTCDTNPANDCIQDCAGTWGGSAYFDDCGTCDDNPSNDCVLCDDLSINLISSADLTCFEANDGAIEIEVISVDPDYNISWNNGNDSESISGLAAGSHQVTVTTVDCIAFLEVVLTQPTELVADVINIVHNPCGETNIGEATISISGGTEPYNILVNGTATTNLEMTDLIGVFYDVDISDANGCAVSTQFEIEDLGCDELDNTQVVAFICEQESIGMFDAVICDPVPNATSYLWELVNTTATAAPIEFSTPSNQFLPADILQIIPENTYEIRVKGMAFNAISDFSSTCTLRMAIGLSALTSSSCGNMNLTINSTIDAIAVEGADDYEFRFEDQITQERLYYYSGSSAVCDLAMVIDLELNTTYDVQVRARYRNIWGQYGDICEAKMLSTMPTTSLDDESCGNNHLNFENDVISVQQIQGATVYQIEFTETETGTKITVESNTIYFSTQLIGNLNLYTEYTAQARALINETWTPWGAVCEVGFIESAAPKLNMIVYPNPIVFGRDIHLQTEGDWKNMELRLCTVMGRDIMKGYQDFQDATPEILRLPELPTGMYLLHLSHGKQMLTKKILIQ